MIFALAAVGIVRAGLVPGAADPRTDTLLAAVLGGVRVPLFVALVFVSVALQREEGWKDLSPRLVFLSSATLVLMLLSVSVLLEVSRAGVGQRVVFLAVYVWAVMVATRIVPGPAAAAGPGQRA